MPSADPRTLLQTLNKLESLRDPTVSKQLRQYSRFVVRGDAELTPMERSSLDQRPVLVMLRDLSRGGVGFVSQQPLPKCSLWRVGFLYQGQVVSQQPMIIRHSNCVDASVYLVGGQFCVETGVMILQGIDHAQIRDGDQPNTGPASTNFVGPGEVV